MTNREKTIA